MKVLLAGASGFIGSKVKSLLQASGIDVTPYDQRKETPAEDSIPDEVCAIINCAGRLGGQSATLHELVESNTRLPIMLAEHAASMEISVIHLSTPGVTGLIVGGKEDADISPWGPYEKTKADAEKELVRILPWEKLTILRPDFVYGPGDMHKLEMFRQVAKGWFPLVGRGTSRVRPTYVDDAANAVIAALPGGCLEGGIYNVGGPEVVSFSHLIDSIACVLGVRVRKLILPRILYEIALGLGPLRPAALTRSRVELFGKDHFVCTEKSRRAGFQPKTHLKDGLVRTVAWYREKGVLV